MADNTPTRGKFIVIEGIDGCGKSTHIKHLTDSLRARGRRVEVTYEPTDGETGQKLRRILSGAEPASAASAAALFLADRVEHNERAGDGILALLAGGTDVICGRYYYSSFAYQGIEVDPEWVINMNLDCPKIARPDLCIFLDIPPARGMERITSRDKLEIFENIDTQSAVRDKFLTVFSLLEGRENIVTINADRDVADVSADIEKAVEAVL